MAERPLQPSPLLDALSRRVAALCAPLWAAARPWLERAWRHIQPVLVILWRHLSRPIMIRGRQWNPVRLDAFYWGRRDPRFWHGLSWSTFFNILLILMFTVSLRFFTCGEEWFLPPGGGENMLMAKQIVVKKKEKKKKYVVNPLSPIRFDVPDIEEMVEQKITQSMAEGLANRYSPGKGKGDGVGFGAGRKGGQVEFVRLQYDGDDWNANIGKDADANVLMEYQLLGFKVAHETKQRTIAQVAASPKFKGLPYVFMTGSGRKMSISDAEVKALRSYLLDNHGMVFATATDKPFGPQFRHMMSRVLPEVRPVTIPRDDELYTGFMKVVGVPFASPHESPMEMTGWKVQGRWVAVYHPGDLSDAWKTPPAIPANEARACMNLTINIINYANVRYNDWVTENLGETK